MGVEVRSHSGPEKPEKEFPIELVQLSELVPHEQTIENELEWFIEGVQESGIIYWPMLIAEDTKLILDGHHRTAGLMELNYANAPAIVIDYLDDDLVQVDTWYPKVEIPPRQILQYFEDKKLDIKKIEFENINFEKLNERDITAYVGNKQEMYQITGNREEIFEIIRDNWIDQIIYYDNPKMCIESINEKQTAVVSWAYTKREIISHVQEGIVHLPKTTRHTLKYKIPKCNYPLEKLEKNNP